MRQSAEWEQHKAELDALECTIYVASVDTLEQSREVIERVGLTYNIAYGVTKDDADLIGAWWQHERNYIQPAEFLLGRGGSVLGSMYASGPMGRMGADEAVRQITSHERQRREQEQARQQSQTGATSTG